VLLVCCAGDTVVFPFLKWGLLFMLRILLIAVCLLIQTSRLYGQLPLLNAEKPEEPEKPEASLPLKDIAAERSRVSAHVEEAVKLLAEAKQPQSTSEAVRNEEDERALQRRFDLFQSRIQVGRRHLKIIDDVQAVRTEKVQLQDEMNGWTGFPSPPPYSLDFVEELGRKLKFNQAAIKTEELRLASFARGKALVTDEFAQAEKTFRKTLEALEETGNDSARQKARRQHALSKLALQANGETVAFVRASEQLIKEKLGLNGLREEFSRRKLKAALQDVRLTREELQERIDGLEKELAEVNTSLAQNNSAETDALQLLEVTQERLAVGRKEKAEPDPVLELELKLIQERLEMLRATIDNVNLHIGYVHSQETFWRQRYELGMKWDFTKARAQVKDIDTTLEIVDGGIKSFFLAQAQVENYVIDSRFANPALASLRDALVQAIAERNTQRQAVQQRAQQLRTFLELWKSEIETRVGDMGASEEAHGWKDVLLDHFLQYWAYELLSVQDTLVVDGERIVEKRPVTIGKVVEAILILTIGLLVASGLSRSISRAILLFSKEKWQGRLLIEKILRLGLTALVVVLALVTVKIPLAVFAFMGGAIALGVGFGAKNLINNFISGFILLGEGTIRAGDRIELDGTLGIVKRIGERSTHVRRVDGVDILIPNSQFLENSVTNLTLSDQRMRLTIEVGVAYGSPTRQVQELLFEIARTHELVAADPAPAVVFQDFGDSALIFRVYVWIDFTAQSDYRAVVTELRHTIAEQFAKMGYEMAFPQRDVHLAAKGPIPVRMVS
jgi:potassium-dependent mechanosensitive channel